jgi:ketopantoate hydroxymethyltransferase
MFTWAFIFKSEDCNHEQHHTELLHCGNRLLIYGVSTIEEGAKVAKKIMEEENCLLIELCGGFGSEGARTVIEAVECKIPVGHIEYLPEAREKLYMVP